MDETEFKTAYYQVNDRPCAFTKAILTRCCGCSRSQKVLIAEREAVTCLSPAAHVRCGEAIAILREKALFALRMTQLEGKLPHGKEIKVECGGMHGLHAAMHQSGARVEDIHALFESALDRYGSIAEFPYTEIVKSVVNYKARQRGGSPSAT
jgi:hypothetical protein